jgi:hypothetical protein
MTDTPCPICGKVMRHDSSYMDHVLMEYSYECENDECPGYTSEFMTGTTRIIIGGKEWLGHYTDSPEKEREDKREQDNRIEYLSADFFNAGP